MFKSKVKAVTSVLNQFYLVFLPVTQTALKVLPHLVASAVSHMVRDQPSWPSRLQHAVVLIKHLDRAAKTEGWRITASHEITKGLVPEDIFDSHNRSTLYPDDRRNASVDFRFSAGPST